MSPHSSQVRQLTPVIRALSRLKQVGHYKFKANLSYRVRPCIKKKDKEKLKKNPFLFLLPFFPLPAGHLGPCIFHVRASSEPEPLPDLVMEGLREGVDREQNQYLSACLSQ